jgi:hypothetical protein
MATGRATTFKKGIAKVPGSGRKAGTPNKTTQDLKEAILESASMLGHLKEEAVLDKDGKPTGRTKLVHDGEGGMTGYLIWLGKNNPAAYAPLLARVLPLQVKQKVENPPKVVYATVEETRAALIARRIDPDVLEKAMMPPWPLPKPLPRPGSAQ